MSHSVRAPELVTSLGWLNTDRPLRFSDELKGQVVVLDFWTYCCINCIHILPDLKFLEEKYRREPVCFIGVHSAKFSNESSRETIRSAVLRYEIEHPVVIDENMKIWRAFAARSWPTLVVVDSRGYVAGVTAGEGNREWLDQAIGQSLEQGKASSSLAEGPLGVNREASVRAVSGLKFPGKVLADADARRLYVADSNHNRVIIAGWPDDGGRAEVIKVIGSGAIGAQDGSADSATFDHPQGLAVGRGRLYVADTENHLIRAVDLTSFEVTTAVGTGQMCNDRAGGGMGTGQGLNSPWDLAIEGSTLYVAMAGAHQIWRIDMPVGFARAFAGSGRENLVDGPTETSALAQPSGICASGGNLYVADSEVSAVRGIDMSLEQVFTVIGEGLFSFGDEDGAHPAAKLQHPLGVDSWQNGLVIADTYNHKIKLIDVGARSARTLWGTGSPGTSAEDGGAAFFEPGGLSVAGDELFVADTNNHRVLRINMKSGAWCELSIEGLRAPASAAPVEAELIKADAVMVGPDGPVELVLDVELPEDAKFNTEAPCSVRVSEGGRTLSQSTGRLDGLPVRLEVAFGVDGRSNWRVDASFAYCFADGNGVCVPVSLSWDLPLESGGGAARATLRASVSAQVCAD